MSGSRAAIAGAARHSLQRLDDAPEVAAIDGRAKYKAAIFGPCMSGETAQYPGLPAQARQALTTSEREIEIKLVTDADELSRAMALQVLSTGEKDKPRRSLHAVYFDTLHRDLRKDSIILRIRKLRGKFYMGFKQTSPLTDGAFRRREVECVVATLEPDISVLGPEIEAELEFILQGRPLQPLFEILVKRLTRTLQSGRSQIEVAFDSGIVSVGHRQAKFNEIEFELKFGDEASLYDLALQVCTALPLQLGTLSKADRGFVLLTGGGFESRRAAHLQLSEHATLDDAIGATLASSINHFTANWPAFNQSRDPESVHQMRVALRRLRAALSLYSHTFPCSEFGAFRAEAARLASALGQARDWDVFLDLIESGPLPQTQQEAEFDSVFNAIEARRKASYEIARASVGAQATTRFVLDIHAFLAHHGWRNACAATELPRLIDPVREFAEEVLKRLHKRVLKRGKRPENLSPEDRHRLRIAVKQVRYASEFFGGVFHSGAEVRAYTRAVSVLQDAFGAFNDRIIATRMLRELEAEVGSEGARAVGIIIGWYAREAEFVDQQLGKAWKAFKHTPTFWNGD
jgi:triphosphatase